eukprot:gene161-773_t
MDEADMNESNKCTIRNFVNASEKPHRNGGFTQQEKCTVKCFVNSSGQPVHKNGVYGLKNHHLEMDKCNTNEHIDKDILHDFDNLSDNRLSGNSKEFDSDSGKADVEKSLTKSETVRCSDNRRSLIKTIVCGQILSLTLCGFGTTSTALAKWYNIRVPAFQAFLTYSCLCITMGVRIVSDKNQIHHVVRARGWKYLILGLVDVEANFLLIKAYTFTTLTSAQLCDSFTIPTVLVLSFLILGVRYKPLHYIGVALCVAGAACLIFTDTRNESNNAKNELLGDFLALSGAFLYGCSNVAQEFIVKEFSKTEFLGMMGIVCAFISGIQAILVERDAIASIPWNWHVVILFVGFVISQYTFYTLTPFVITLSSAAVANLSLLTSDLYTLLFGLFLFGYKFSYLYFIAFGGIFAGLITYNWKPTPVAPRRTKEAKEQMATLSTSSHQKIADSSEKTKLVEKDSNNHKNGIIPKLKYTNGYTNIADTEV